METITLQEFQDRCRAQGVPPQHVAFECLRCGTVQSMASLIAAGHSHDEAIEAVGVACIDPGSNRLYNPMQTILEVPSRGCNLNLRHNPYLASLAVNYCEDTYPFFALASPEEARALMAQMEALAAQPPAGGEG